MSRYLSDDDLPQHTKDEYQLLGCEIRELKNYFVESDGKRVGEFEYDLTAIQIWWYDVNLNTFWGLDEYSMLWFKESELKEYKGIFY